MLQGVTGEQQQLEQGKDWEREDMHATDSACAYFRLYAL